MKSRQRVNRRRDRRIFKRTANQVCKLNLPGSRQQMGGTRF